MIDDAALLERRETRERAGARMKKAVSADADNRSRTVFYAINDFPYDLTCALQQREITTLRDDNK